MNLCCEGMLMPLQNADLLLCWTNPLKSEEMKNNCQFQLPWAMDEHEYKTSEKYYRDNYNFLECLTKCQAK